MIEHDNIIYISHISKLGGVETFAYEMAKKYKNLDIAVVFKSCDVEQYKRLRKYCKAYKHTNQRIKCKTIVINYDNSILDYVEDIDNVEVCETIHADYCNSNYKMYPVIDKRVKRWLGITEHICKSFGNKFGVKTELCYNPLTINEEEPIITLLSATRLSPIKGKSRMIKLVKALDEANVNYIWYVFTNDTDEINSENVKFMQPTLDISKWFQQADYVVQLSDTEACSYTINEALYRNIPVIVTPLPYLESIGYKDGKTGYTVEFDCSNINEVVKNITNIPKFNFNRLEDNYANILSKGKSHYEEDMMKNYVVKALRRFTDLEDKVQREKDEVFKCTEERCNILVENKYATLVKIEVPEVKKESKVKETVEEKQLMDELTEKVKKSSKVKKTIKK